MSQMKRSDIENRLSPNIRGLEAYKVPDIDCSIRLDGNESPFNVAWQLPETFVDELTEIEFNRYPDSSHEELRDKIYRHIGIPAEGIVLGNGSDELIQMIIQCFAGKTGRVLVPAPTFSMYKLSAIALGKEVVEVDLDESFNLDLDRIMEVIKKQDPDILFFASPNNPTSNIFSEDRLIKITEATSGLVVIDEAYIEYYGRSLMWLLGDYDNVIVLRTMSKIGFAALRLGILFSSPYIAEQINKVRLPYNISSLSYKLATRVFENYDQVEKNIDIIKSERDIMYDSLSKISGVDVYPSDANFLLVDVGDSSYVFNELVKRDILVRKLDSSERLNNCLRITVGNPDENRALVNALSDIFSS